MNPELNNIRLLLVAGIAIMLLLFVSFLLIFIFTQRNKYRYRQNLQTLKEVQQNQLIEAAVRSEETERLRIAEELHDEVGALLSASKLHLQGVEQESLDNKFYNKGRELLDDAIHKVRGISHNLHSNILQEFGLNEAIRHFLSKISQKGIIETDTFLDDTYVTINPGNDITIYRIIQELVNNILKHGKPKSIYVKSAFKNKTLHLSLFHNGLGLTQEQFEVLRYKKDGLGLKNIQNRIIMLKGKIEFSLKHDGLYYIDIFVS